ncbi:MAG: DUF5056 domain-containing protein [Prevotellaceae bacterium]|nr:DUF5056 domain-containing protein [Prevotellaceae bacterium]
MAEKNTLQTGNLPMTGDTRHDIRDGSLPEADTTLTPARERLLRQYFTDNKPELPDDGFTRRVMHRLPRARRRAARRLLLGNLIGYTAAAILFIALGGIEATGNALVRLLEQATQHAHYNPQTVVVVVVVLIYLLCRKVCSLR